MRICFSAPSACGHGLGSMAPFLRRCFAKIPAALKQLIFAPLRRECLDHVVVLAKTHLRRMVRRYLSLYHGARTHMALEKDAPDPRSSSRRSQQAGPRTRPARVLARSCREIRWLLLVTE